MSLSSAEKVFLEKSGRKAQYASEHLPVIETEHVCELGKLAALSFIEWALENPEGVIALPTGKTPELFILYLKHYKEHWSEPETEQDLRSFGIIAEHFPETSRMKFVQLDEFFPIDPDQENSFTSYIRRYYLSLLDISEENVLWMKWEDSSLFPDGKVDWTLFEREAVTEQEKKQQEALQSVERFCREYEDKVRLLGGIGFFLGGIGVDGHIAFNMPGSDHESRTRLVQLNYPTAAQAAGDLGGIEHSRDKSAITIGLRTITQNADAKIIILAAGEVKAPVVADAVEQQASLEYPATALHSHPGARFYVTKGAGCNLRVRKLEDLEKLSADEIPQEKIDAVLVNLALHLNKRLADLTSEDLQSLPESRVLQRKFREKSETLIQQAHHRLIAKIERGLHLPEGKTLLHTAPHHDDVMLSYHPMLSELLPRNKNLFAYLTSGFNSVTNHYMMSILLSHSEDEIPPGIFEENYEEILRNYLNAANEKNEEKMTYFEWLVMVRNVALAFDLQELDALKEKVYWLREEYFPNQHPGQKDIFEVQVLKGSMRESESDRMLYLAGVNLDDIYHLRAHFYTGDYFNPLPSIEKDAAPMLQFYRQSRPDVITVAFDPEGTGPDTHYKVLQIVAEGLRLAKEEVQPKIWGYRNVWHRFPTESANLMMPVNDHDLECLNFAFLNCFSTQKKASFPPPNYDGPFSGLSEVIQRDQYEKLKVLLGEDFFTKHPDERMRSASGFVFIKEMDKEEFFKHAQQLKSRIELVGNKDSDPL